MKRVNGSKALSFKGVVFTSSKDSGFKVFAAEGTYNDTVLAFGNYHLPNGWPKLNAETEASVRDGVRLYYSEIMASKNQLPVFVGDEQWVPKSESDTPPKGALVITATYAWGLTPEQNAGLAPKVAAAVQNVRTLESRFYSTKMGRIIKRYDELTKAETPEVKPVGTGPAPLAAGATEDDKTKGRGSSPAIWKDRAAKAMAELAKGAVYSRTKRGDLTAPTPEDFKLAEAAFWKALRA
jgi:hypothetical protein